MPCQPLTCALQGRGRAANDLRVTQHRTDDLRITSIRPLISPAVLAYYLPITEKASEVVARARAEAAEILRREDDRLLVVVGPCSIHDPESAMEYARKLKAEADKHKKELCVVMRVYFEKPRTTVGWKGLINDPNLDDSFDINHGLRIARKLLLDLANLGLPAGSEFLDAISPQYVADLIAWGAIGARTTESQVHRELASGLSSAVGFKNGTDGNVKIAAAAILAARQRHHFLSVHKSGQVAIVDTLGNADCHIILRGGMKPNYDPASVNDACADLARFDLPGRLMVDLSHGNTPGGFQHQLKSGSAVAEQIAAGEQRIFGVSAESHLVEGRQDLQADQPLTYGQSLTDPCIGWDDSVALLEELAEAVRARRRSAATTAGAEATDSA